MQDLCLLLPSLASFLPPPPPFIFSRLSLFLSPPFLKYFLHHIKERTTFLLSPPLTTFLGPFSSSWFFYSTILFSHPHHLSLHQPFLSLSIIVPFPMVDVLTSFVFFTAHSQQQKKLISQHFISFEFNCFCRWICVQSLSKYALSFHAGLNFCELWPKATCKLILKVLTWGNWALESTKKKKETTTVQFYKQWLQKRSTPLPFLYTCVVDLILNW